MNSKQQMNWFILLVFFALLEFLMLSYLQGYFGMYFSPLVFFMASAGVSIMGLYASYYFQEVKAEDTRSFTPVYLLLPLVSGLIWAGYSVFSKQPVDYNQSDVFAQVLSPAQWLLKGEYAYQDVVLPTYTMHNTYLPAQWMPFIISVLFNFDPRWIPVVVWSGTFLLFVYMMVSDPVLNRSKHRIIFFFIGMIAVFSMFGFIVKNRFDYAVSLEMLPVAYYILLVLALLRGSWMGIGLTAGLCLMSRFSVILLAPFLLWYVWQRFGLQILWKSVGTTIVFIIMIFVLPFMTKDSRLPSKIVANYNNGALGEWQVHSWQEPGSEPYQIARGLGAAIFFKKLYEYDLPAGVRHLRQVGFGLSLLSGFFLIYLYQRNRQHLNKDWILLGGLKLYFTFFYTFALIPYPYLFVLPLSITALLLIKGYVDVVRKNISVSGV